MSFDFKKEYREFYLPKAKPEIVDRAARKLYRRARAG